MCIWSTMPCKLYVFFTCLLLLVSRCFSDDDHEMEEFLKREFSLSKPYQGRRRTDVSRRMLRVCLNLSLFLFSTELFRTQYAFPSQIQLLYVTETSPYRHSYFHSLSLYVSYFFPLTKQSYFDVTSTSHVSSLIIIALWLQAWALQAPPIGS